MIDRAYGFVHVGSLLPHQSAYRQVSHRMRGKSQTFQLPTYFVEHIENDHKLCNINHYMSKLNNERPSPVVKAIASASMGGGEYPCSA